MKDTRRWPDAQPFLPDAEYIKRGATFDDRTTGIAITKWSNRWMYVIDTTSGNIQVVLPAAANTVDVEQVIKRSTGGANTCTLSSDGGNIDGTASYTIATQYASVRLISDGVNWWST